MAPEQKATGARLKSPALIGLLLLAVLLLPLLLRAADPMLTFLDDGQLQDLRRQHEAESALVFTESREFPIRHADGLPTRWLPQTQAARPAFNGQARPGEFYVFQLGVYALKDTGPLASHVHGVQRAGTGTIPANALALSEPGGNQPPGTAVHEGDHVETGPVAGAVGGGGGADDATGSYTGTARCAWPRADHSC